MVKTYWKANLNKSLYRLLQFPDQLHLSSQGYSDLGQLKPDQPRLCCQGESFNLSKSTCGRLCIPSLKSSVQSTIRLSMWPKAPLITRSGTISTFRGKDILNIVVVLGTYKGNWFHLPALYIKLHDHSWWQLTIYVLGCPSTQGQISQSIHWHLWLAIWMLRHPSTEGYHDINI